MSEEPAYLTSPGDALATRASWETRYEQGITDALKAHLVVHSLTAAAFPRWADAARDLLRQLPRIPRAFMNRLLLAAPGDDAESPADIAKRLAPTLATAAYNTHVLQLLVEHDYSKKAWVCRHDPKVRPTHLEADGQTVALSRPFIVGGHLIQFPAESTTAPIDIWINCRCVVIGRR